MTTRRLEDGVLLVVTTCLWLSLQACEGRLQDGPDLDRVSQQRLGSFLVLGDWGWDPEVHGNLDSRACQQAIADAMDQKMNVLGDVKFVINVGDSFYPNGVASKSDPQWDSKWRDVYSSKVRSVPWYSVYGNHDYTIDPCACSDDIRACGQINDNASNTDFFYMPNLSWFMEHPELDTEIIAMDTNYYTWLHQTCLYTPCPEACASNLKARADAAFELFYARVAASRAKNLLVFSHYPTDYFPGGPWNESTPIEDLDGWAPSWLRMPRDELPHRYHHFLGELSNSSRSQIIYFGGHRHNVDQSSTASTGPHCNWLVGGGGGWSTDGKQQGFVVGEIAVDGHITTYREEVDFDRFCRDGAVSPPISFARGRGCDVGFAVAVAFLQALLSILLSGPDP